MIGSIHVCKETQKEHTTYTLEGLIYGGDRAYIQNNIFFNRMGYIMYLGAYNWGFLKWYFTVGE